MTHSTYFVKKDEDHCNVGVLVSGGHDVKVVVLDEGVSALLGWDQGCQRPVLLLVGDQSDELIDDAVFNVAAIISGYQDFALHVQEIDGRQRHRGPV